MWIEAKRFRLSYDDEVRNKFFNNDRELKVRFPSAIVTGKHKKIRKATQSWGSKWWILNEYKRFNKESGRM